MHPQRKILQPTLFPAPFPSDKQNLQFLHRTIKNDDHPSFPFSHFPLKKPRTEHFTTKTTMESRRNNLFHGPFTPSQLQELHNQAIIFNFISLGLGIPPHLLLYLTRQFPQDWGCLRLMRSNGREEDPEPGRCRRTDGKKWRCSRVACADSKYCVRHLHRGKNRLRKHMDSSVLPPENQRKRAAHEDLRYCHGGNDNGGDQASSSATSGLSFQHCFVMGKDLSLDWASESDKIPISLHCFFDDRPKDERREEELIGSAATNPASSFSLFDLNF